MLCGTAAHPADPTRENTRQSRVSQDRSSRWMAGPASTPEDRSGCVHGGLPICAVSLPKAGRGPFERQRRNQACRRLFTSPRLARTRSCAALPWRRSRSRVSDTFTAASAAAARTWAEA